jgi:hypothetical protein
MEQAVRARAGLTRKCALVRRRLDRRVWVFYAWGEMQNKPGGPCIQRISVQRRLNSVVV